MTIAACIIGGAIIGAVVAVVAIGLAFARGFRW